MKHKLLLILLSLSFFQLRAQTHKNEIGVQTDNDSYLANGSDRYYTNGIFIHYRHALDVPANSSLANKVLGFEAGQKMYNPQSGSVPDPVYIDRPFAAYLYVGSTLNLLYKNDASLKLGAQLGVVGPAALGKQVQNIIHNTFGFYPTNGWQYQIRNNVELNLSAEYVKLLARSDWADISFDGYANLGNGFTGAGLGPLIRLGDFNQLFNSVSTQSTATSGSTNGLLHKRELFFYYKPQINTVIYDATVQGGLFNKHDPNSEEITLDPERFVLSNQVGVGYSGSRFVADAGVLFHSRDVKQMVHVHQWGTVTLLYRFH